MPATITHAYFGKDVYDILPVNIKNKIDIKRIKTFGQGMDSLMFYNLFNPLPGKNIRKFDNYFHNNKTRAYFISLINYIKNNNLINDKDSYSYLCGLICHYALDSTVHPYVFYYTGSFKKKNPNTYKYNNQHEFMETFIDNDMVRRRENSNPYNFNISKFAIDKKRFSNNLNKTLDYSFEEVFHLNNMSKIYYSSLKQMSRALTLFRKDSSGLKRIIYMTVDTFTPNNTFRFEAISYHYPLKDNNNYLNNNHILWRNPIDYNLTSKESFIDLYIKALKLAKVLIEISFYYINGNNYIKLEDFFTNRSYTTGLDCDLGSDLKYFAY
jgi:hypothetical protein